MTKRRIDKCMLLRYNFDIMKRLGREEVVTSERNRKQPEDERRIGNLL